MEPFDSGGFGGVGHNRNQDLSLLNTPSPGAESTVFDASQYAFFAGNQVVDEVELGGLEEDDDDGDNTDIALPTFNEDEDEEDYMLHKNEDVFLQPLSALNDLGGNLTKIELNDARENGISVDRMTSVNNSYNPPWQQDNSNGWSDQHIFDSERALDGKVWSYSHPDDSQSVQRIESYSREPPFPLDRISGDPLVVPGSSFTSFPPSMSRDPYLLNFHEHHLNKPHRPETLALSPPNISSSNLASQFNVNPLSLASRPQKLSTQWENRPGSFPPVSASLLSSSLQQSPSQSGAMNQFFVHQQHSHYPIRPSHGHLMGTQVMPRNSHPYSVPNMLNKFDPMPVAAGRGDQHQQHILAQGGRQNTHNSQLTYESAGQRRESWWPSRRSKFMTADELDNILRMQLAATHSNDPYVDDYYHQASLAKKADGARFRRHFCPANLRDGHPGARANTESHAYLQVDALGRVPFSSIRRPRPLIEIDSPSSTSLICNVANGNEKPLDREPLLAARLAIESGMDLLLDVDDIDRFLKFNQLQDGGAHLRRKRQKILKDVADSLHLVDFRSKNFQSAGLISEDDLLFLRLVSLPKGRKFLACYIQHLVPGDDLLRLVFTAIFRNLRFLFDFPPMDPRAAEATANLARVVASSVRGLDLGALGACLAAVVCSSERPQFRPIGSLAGDGSSVILASVLQRATDLLTDPRASETCNVSDRALWQASFDEFFGILTMYCMKMYDAIIQTLVVRNSAEPAFLLPDAAGAIRKEMPVDLLRASLPHTNEQQRMLLLQFAQRAMPAS